MAGLTLVAEGIAYIGEGSGPGLGIGLLLIVSGVALSAGFMTPVSGLLAILAELGSMLAWFPAINLHLFDVRTTVIDVIAMCAAIICIGPGAISVDARLFGRREIIIPSSRPPKL